ncbi:uncharacterized protein AAG666_020117 [Megaptera novaeangliae]
MRTYVWAWPRYLETLGRPKYKQNFAKEKGIVNKSPFYKTPQTMTGDLNWKCHCSPVTQGSGMDQPSYSLAPAHTASPWKRLVRPCLAAGSEDLSSAAPVLHRFSLNKPGF